MESAVTIGLDLGKSVFQVHGVDAGGAVVVQRRLTRSKLLAFFAKQPACLVGMEACAAAHHWGRELRKLGHRVRLIPPRYVKPYVKRQKNDAADAEAICEAVTRPSMRFVEIKSLRTARDSGPSSRAADADASARAAVERDPGPHGRVRPGRSGGPQWPSAIIAILGNPDDERVPAVARASLAPLVCQFDLINGQVLENDRRVRASARSTELGCRLMEVPGVGPVLASAMVATVPDPAAFKSGRNLAAWIGLVPRQNSSGGKEKLGGITKQGDRYLRQLLVAGALAVIRYAQRHGTKRPWLVQLLARRTPKIAAVALANKMARMIWAMMMTGERYREPKVAAA